MEVVAHRLSDHMGRMYQEGQGLHNRCVQMESTMQAEIDKAAAWYDQQLKEVKKTGDAWVQNYKADLDRRFEEEKAELRAKIQHDSETLQQRLLLSDKNSSDTAQQRLEEITRDMTEKFNQQKMEYQEELDRKSIESMEELRRNCDPTWHTSLATEVERSRKELEGDFYKSAQSYKDSISADLARRKTTLDERAESTPPK